MSSNALADLLASGAALFGQGNRLLTLRFSDNGILEDALLPHVVRGEEAFSTCYHYSLDCLSADTHLELKEVLGQPVEVAILLPEGGQRLLTGLVTEVVQLGADGGFAKYRLTIEPALATLAHRRNSRVFQDKSVVEIVQAILDEHTAGNAVFASSFHHEARLQKSYLPRSYCLQYRESDLAFIERLLREEGISYRFTHGPGKDSLRDSDDEGQDVPLHTLILFDDNQSFEKNQQESIRFHRTDGIETADAIDQWTASRRLQSCATSVASFDYKAVSTLAGGEESQTDQGQNGLRLSQTLEDYDPQTLYYGNNTGDVSRYAALRQQAKDLASKTFSGEGTVRSLLPGTWFGLLEHPIHDQDYPEDREFLVTGVSFEAANNLTPEARQGLGNLLDTGAEQNRPPYRNRFTVVRRHVPVVPAYHQTQHQKPTAAGSTTATVVGPEGEEIYTDEHGRIKIQFHWQRTQDHPEGGANLDDRSSTWVRVAMPSAGAGWGTQYIPRIGQEVVVDFLEGDIDRPMVTGVVYNGSHSPPAFSGAGSLPANKTLSGVKSKEYKGSRYNELLFDDSTGQIRTKLSSEHAKTQLNQGFLIHPRTDGKGDARGEGFELRTDAAGAIRAAKGLLLSTEPKGAAAGKQLDRDVLIQMLTAALELAERLGDHAAEQQANQTETGRNDKLIEDDARPGETKTDGHQTQLRGAIGNLERGTNTDPKGNSGEGKQAGGQQVIALAAPDGIALASPKSISTVAGTNLDQIAQRDTNQTTGRRWIHNVAESISLFVAGSGAKLKETFKITAAKGDLRVQAQDGKIEQSAQKDFTITSVAGKVVVQAPNEILLTAGGGYIRIGSSIEIHNPGTQSQKAGSFSLTGPTSLNAPAELPKGALKPCKLQLADAAASGSVGIPR